MGNRKQPNKGFTLVAVILAIVLIFAIGLGLLMFVSHGLGRVAVDRNRSTALEVANSRLEEMRASGYESIEPGAFGATGLIMIQKNADGDGWEENQADDETVVINGSVRPITTTVQYVVGSLPDSIVEAVVSVGFQENPDERVTLLTHFAEKLND